MATKPEARKKLAFNILDGLFNVGDLSVIDRTCSKNITVQVPGATENLKGIEALKKFVKNFLEAFTNIHLHVDDIHAEGDLVDVHATITATSTRSFLGMPATQKEVTAEPVFFFKFGPDGKLVEYSQEMDIIGLMR